ncbi:MAG: bifunctional diguanylate cyclase/phosphodiesterase [Bacillota bacterium]
MTTKNLATTVDIEVYELKQKFIKNKNIDESYSQLLNDIISYFDFDRIFMGMKSVLKNECVPVFECLKGDVKHSFGEVIDFEGFTKFSSVDITENEQHYIDICDCHNYFQSDTFHVLDELLDHLGYLPSDLGTPSECMVFYIKDHESFSYMFAERYGNDRPLLTKLQQVALCDIHEALKMKITINILEQRLYNEVQMKNSIIENEKTPICLVEKNEFRVIYYNDYYEEYMPNVHLGVTYADLFYENESNITICSETVILKDAGTENAGYWIKKNIPFSLIDGTEVYMTYLKNTQEYIKELEDIDLLTTAFSLSGFSEYFTRLVEENETTPFVLCTMDIDKFKYVNDVYSFSVGNQVLKKVVDVLNGFIEGAEAFCRMNEDKFAFVLRCDSKEEIKERLNTLFGQLEAMKDEYFPSAKLSFICGVVDVSTDFSINALIDMANIARKTTKGSHLSSYAFFDKDAETRRKAEILLEAKVPKAVENDEFVPYLQPKFELSTMKICGAEALVRWHGHDGMIYPDQFIPLFEKNGFITTLDFIMYRKVMAYIRSCIDRGLEVYPISLNVSRNHIQNKNFLEQFMELVHKYDVPIHLIELEVTESVFVENKETLNHFVSDIKRANIKVSIDDFGTAYSSLQTLKDIEIDVLKIDKGFLDNIDFSHEHQFTKDEAVLKNIIHLASDLNCKVICEGIETDAQIELLKNINCEYGQGYVFAKPMPLAEYEERYLT